MTESPYKPSKLSKPGKRQDPPIRTECFLWALKDVIWLKPMQRLAPEDDSAMPNPAEAQANDADPGPDRIFLTFCN
ncbi:MAG: hypothetical protein KGQ79_00695 [Proteobacteria bacterium]|nr:hypothetical protein [Pseudomonadota bacterium]MBU6424899.1 hypothetical protein [Rhodospirillales bacterium]